MNTGPAKIRTLIDLNHFLTKRGLMAYQYIGRTSIKSILSNNRQTHVVEWSVEMQKIDGKKKSGLDPCRSTRTAFCRLIKTSSF